MIEKMGGDFLQWLRGFHAVMVHGSTAAAADALGVRQPTVSHHIQMLESELAVQLFQRTQRKLIPTREGRELYERASTLFSHIRQIKNEIGRIGNEAVKGEISLVTTHSVGQNYLPRAIATFSERHPEAVFRITGVTESSLILDKVQSSEVELGIAPGPNFPASIVSRPLFTSPLALLVPKTLASQRNMRFRRTPDGSLADLSELAGMPYVAFSPDALLTHYLHEILARHNISVRTTIQVNTSLLLTHYVREGFGITILDAFTAAAHADALDIYPIEEIAAPRTYFLIYRGKSYISPQATAFMEHLLRFGDGVPNTFQTHGQTPDASL